MTKNTPQHITGLSSIIDSYDGFFIDLWGVIFDGKKIPNYARHTIEKLYEHNKKVLILSNFTRRTTEIAQLLENNGISRKFYTDVLTSGELTHHLFRTIAPKVCFRISWPGEEFLLHDLYFTETTNIEEANLIFLTGLSKSIEEYIPVLEKACHIPMICVNPDVVAQNGNNELYLCSGALADVFEKMGGSVYRSGKPYAPIYKRAKEILKTERNLLIGDSMRHDIGGAYCSGSESVLVKSGIHQRETQTPEAIEKLFNQYNFKPTYLIDTLTW